jgi:hypothetical protein
MSQMPGALATPSAAAAGAVLAPSFAVKDPPDYLPWVQLCTCGTEDSCQLNIFGLEYPYGMNNVELG